jgi:hypothetical protein
MSWLFEKSPSGQIMHLQYVLECVLIIVTFSIRCFLNAVKATRAFLAFLDPLLL